MNKSFQGKLEDMFEIEDILQASNFACQTDKRYADRFIALIHLLGSKRKENDN
jgi:hypothetical protein